VRRRLTTLAGPLATATLALGTAAWAATADVPLAPGNRMRALAVTAQATGPVVSNGSDGSAIFSTDALAPGQVETGEVTIANAGDAAGAFSLSASGASGPLADVLVLTVVDTTAASTLFAGRLASFSRADLGTFAVGAARRYRFALAYPAGRTAAEDDALQGVSTSVRFDWDAVGAGGAARPTPAPISAAPAAAPAAPSVAPAPAAAAPAATPAPAPARASALTVALGPAPRPVADGRLVTWMSSSAPTTARVTGTVSFSGRRLALGPATVKLTAQRRTVRLKLPAAAVSSRAKRTLTVRLAIAAGTGARAVTVKRTLRVTAP
jgi:pyruvate/2-oxoglutarate dehydrogenase complex dihydrolipoamide acyltransferase (E2) component